MAINKLEIFVTKKLTEAINDFTSNGMFLHAQEIIKCLDRFSFLFHECDLNNDEKNELLGIIEMVLNS